MHRQRSWHGKTAQLGIEEIETALGDGRPYLGGKAPSVADCTLAAGLDFALKRGFLLLPRWVAVDGWRRRFWARSSAAVRLRWRPA